MNARLAGSRHAHADMKGCQLRVQRGGRNLHIFKGLGPEQRGPDRLLGIKPAPAPPGTARAAGHRPAGASAALLGGAWLVLKSTIRTSSGRYHQPVDLPRHQRRRPPRPLQPADDRDLGAAAGGEHRRQSAARRSGRAPCRPARPVGLASSRRRCAPDEAKRGLAPALGGDVGQRLQQPVHQRAALQRPRARLRLIRPTARCGRPRPTGRRGAADRRRRVSRGDRRPQPVRQRDAAGRTGASQACRARRDILRPRE